MAKSFWTTNFDVTFGVTLTIVADGELTEVRANE